MKKTLVLFFLAFTLLFSACTFSGELSANYLSRKELPFEISKGQKVLGVDIVNDFHKYVTAQAELIQKSWEAIYEETWKSVIYSFYLDMKDINERPFVEVYDMYGNMLHFDLSGGVSGRYFIKVSDNKEYSKMFFAVKSNSEFEVSLYQIYYD